MTTIQTIQPELRTYQSLGATFLSSNDGALLADEMGLGKTVQASVALSMVLSEEGGKALVVAPASVKFAWQYEIRKWAPSLSVRIVRGSVADRKAWYSLPINVLIMTYETLRIDAKLLSEFEFSAVVLDEAHRIKNPYSKVALGCRALNRKRSWALTGTPLENRFQDYISIFRFVNPNLIGPYIDAPTVLEATKPYVLRRLAEDVFDQLPEIIEQVMEMELSEEQRITYNEIWNNRHVINRGQDPTPISSMFAILTKLKQICNFDPDTDRSSKQEALMDILDGLEGSQSKILVFSQYVQTLEWLTNRIPKSFRVSHITGEVKEEERENVIRRFEESDGDEVLLVSLRAGGVGLNLGSATHVLLYDRWWNPALEEQAIRRAYRFGRTKPLLVYKFLVLDSVEERIQDILDAKSDLFDQVVGPLHGGELNRDSLRRILALTE